MEIVIEGEDAAATTRDLREWLRRADLEDVNVEFAPGKPVPGTLGVEFVATLLLFLKTKVAGQVVSSITTWVGSKKPRVKLTFKSGKKQLTLDTENTAIDANLIKNLRDLMSEMP